MQFLRHGPHTPTLRCSSFRAYGAMRCVLPAATAGVFAARASRAASAPRAVAVASRNLPRKMGCLPRRNPPKSGSAHRAWRGRWASFGSRRGFSPTAALPDQISGLTYVKPNPGVATSLFDVAALTRQNEAKQMRQNNGTAKGATNVTAPPGSVTVTLGGWQLVTMLALVTVASVSTCGAIFFLVASPALKAVTAAAVAAERAMVEFEKLSVKTEKDLPETLREMETCAKEWDALGIELREVLRRVERWGQFSGADEALTKITSSILEEPGRAVATTMDEAESYIKRLTDDFSTAVAQLTDWESKLGESVKEAAFRETWEKKELPSGDYKNKANVGDLADLARAALAQRQRAAVAEAIGAAEAATERARLASLALLDNNAFGDSSQGGAMARAMAAQADAVASSLRNALLAVEEAKTAAADKSVFDSFDENLDDGDGTNVVDVEVEESK